MNIDDIKVRTEEEFNNLWVQDSFPGWDGEYEEDMQSLKSLFCIACKYVRFEAIQFII